MKVQEKVELRVHKVKIPNSYSHASILQSGFITVLVESHDETFMAHYKIVIKEPVKYHLIIMIWGQNSS